MVAVEDLNGQSGGAVRNLNAIQIVAFGVDGAPADEALALAMGLYVGISFIL